MSARLRLISAKFLKINMFFNIHNSLDLTPVKLEVEKKKLNSEWLWPYCAKNEPSAIQCNIDL